MEKIRALFRRSRGNVRSLRIVNCVRFRLNATNLDGVLAEVPNLEVLELGCLSGNIQPHLQRMEDRAILRCLKTLYLDAAHDIHFEWEMLLAVAKNTLENVTVIYADPRRVDAGLPVLPKLKYLRLSWPVRGNWFSLDLVSTHTNPVLLSHSSRD